MDISAFVESFREEIESASGSELLEFCAMRTGFTIEQTKSLLLNDLVSFAAIRKEKGDAVIASAAIGSLLDLLLLRVSGDLRRELLEMQDEVGLEPQEYIRRYRETRKLLIEQHGWVSPEIWPDADMIELADTKGYKGCHGNTDDYSYDYSSSSDSDSVSSDSYSSGSGSSDGGSEGGCLVLFVGLLGWWIYSSPYVAISTIGAVVAGLWATRFIPPVVSFLLYSIGAVFGSVFMLNNLAGSKFHQDLVQTEFYQAYIVTDSRLAIVVVLLSGLLAGVVGICFSGGKKENDEPSSQNP